MFQYCAFLVSILLLTPASLRAESFVEHIWPPAVERGKTTRVTFVGHELAGALELWHSLPASALNAKAIESRADRAIFDIEVAPDAPVGVLGTRVATRDGLSNVHLFLIDDLPVKIRASGDTPRVELPAAICSRFRDAEVDRYQIDVKAGERVSFEAVGSRFGKNADPLLTIQDAQGRWIAERDNDPGLYFDFRFEHRFVEAGKYTIGVRDSRYHGSEHFTYVLRMGRFPAAKVAVPAAVKPGRNLLALPEIDAKGVVFDCPPGRHPGLFFGSIRRPDDNGSAWIPLCRVDGDVAVAQPYDDARAKALSLAASNPFTLAFNWSPLKANPFRALETLINAGRAQATPVNVPGTFCGVLQKPGERQSISFPMVKGQSIYARAESQSLNSPADLEFMMINHLGREVRRGQENAGALTLDFSVGAPASYGLTVHDQVRDGGPAFTYQLTVSDKPFPPQLVAEVEGLTIPQGSYQPVPIAVTRGNGTAPGPIQLKLLGAPPGMTLTPIEISEKETAVVARLEAGSATPVGVFAVQIVGETTSGPTLVKTLPLIDRQIINVDLIKYALREDQRRVPPSLADRLAVQITPPAPFTLELPEQQITLPRYQRADIPVTTTRSGGFDGPITITAKGGQLADKNEGRTRVYAEFPDATTKQLNVTGSIHSKILSNVGKTRIEVTGTGVQQGRRIALTRTFELNLAPAFSFPAEPVKVSMLPGESAKVRLPLNKMKSFDGDVTLMLSPIQGLIYPEMVRVPKGQSGVDVAIKAETDAGPRKQGIQVYATALVDGFEEEQRASPIEVEIRKVEPPKKETPKKEAPKKK